MDVHLKMFIIGNWPAEKLFSFDNGFYLWFTNLSKILRTWRFEGF